MKIVAIGDIHGSDLWKKIVEKEQDADKIIFVGDYFDSLIHDGLKQIENFKDIVAFKESMPDKVILLTGNHDLHYISSLDERYSGYQGAFALAFEELINKAIDKRLMQACYLHDRIFFSHAGVTKTWLSSVTSVKFPIIDDEMVTTINDMLIYKPSKFCFRMGDKFSQNGDDITQGPMWVRPYSLMLDMIIDTTFVVGHTKVKRMGINSDYPNIILIDCLETSGEYLVLENGVPTATKID